MPMQLKVEVNSCKTFGPKNCDPKILDSEPKMMWLIPEIWNQKVMIWSSLIKKKKLVRIFQITIAMKHGYRLDAVVELMKALEKVDFKVKLLPYQPLWVTSLSKFLHQVFKIGGEIHRGRGTT